ncbi:MAG: hypothetical protein QM689_01615 [Oscillospiraceae bacterium]
MKNEMEREFTPEEQTERVYEAISSLLVKSGIDAAASVHTLSGDQVAIIGQADPDDEEGYAFTTALFDAAINDAPDEVLQEALAKIQEELKRRNA